MTTLASDAAVDVDRVVEVDEPGKIVHAIPDDGFA
jgi:hypothetical protein